MTEASTTRAKSLDLSVTRRFAHGFARGFARGFAGRRSRRALLLCLPVLAALASLLWGARPGIGPSDLGALFVVPAPDDAAGIVVRELRFPRTLGGLLVGAALGAAGALMQALTRNPLAEPGLLGVNAGAAFAVVVTLWAVGPLQPATLVLPALGGALAAAGLVWALASASVSPGGLILAGAAVAAMLLALVRALVLVDPQTFELYRQWSLGSLDGVQLSTLSGALPLALVGIVGGALAARRLDALALGDDLGRTLGARLASTRALTLGAVAALSAAAVLVAGPLGFVGLVVPHAARALGVSGTGALTAASAALGATLVVLADLAGRTALPGIAIQVGVAVALIGGPTLVWIVRRRDVQLT